jgi:3-phosphoshikimate 1-carboxyvinyltransferase
MELFSEKSGSVHGNVVAPPSKSMTHRAILFGMMSGRKMRIMNALISEDTKSTIGAARLMGSDISVGRTIAMEGEMHQAEDVVNASNSGTTARLLSSICSLMSGHTVITGDSSLRSRPMEPVIDAIRQLGGKAFSTLDNGRLPSVFGGPMTKSSARLRSDISSQFASSLAMSCPVKEGETEIVMVKGMQSVRYLELTLQMVDYFGGKAEREGNIMYFNGGGSYRARDIAIAGDYSSASFIIAASAITGGSVTVTSLSNDFAQADSVILDVAEKFGCNVERNGDSVTVSASGLDGTDIDCAEMPDIFPITCVIASAARGKSIISGSQNLRVKETDRIETTCSMLKNIGVEFSADGNSIRIKGGKIRGGVVDSYGDHRIAMSAAVAGLASAKGILVKDAGCYSVSYPSFLKDLRRIGGKVSRV